MKVTTKLFQTPVSVIDLRENVFYTGVNTGENNPIYFFMKGEAGIWIVNATDGFFGVEPNEDWIFDNLCEIRELVKGESFTIEVN
jgi:hypothetical protein